MTLAITEEAVRALADGELTKVGEWIATEQKVREKRRKEQTLAKIRELAKSIEVGVRIDGKRMVQQRRHAPQRSISTDSR